MAYEYAVLSCMGGDDGNGSGVLLAYGQAESMNKILALDAYYKPFGGYVLYESLFDKDSGVGQ